MKVLRVSLGMSLVSLPLLAANQAAAKAAEPIHYEEVLVTASALRTPVGEAVQPATVIRGDQLEQNLATDIGSVLEKTPGVSNAGFGPGVGQPVIRGLGAGRVRTLQDGVDTFDAASVSADHAIASDPLAAEAIEILRGPATLVYGSGAIGGVVNAVDHAMHESPTEEAEAQIRLGYDNGKDGVFGSAEVGTGNGEWALHLGGSWTDAQNIEIPGHAEANPEPGEEHSSQLENSAVETQSGTLGVAWHGQRGFLGVALERFETSYGVPGHAHGHGGAEPEPVSIDLDQDRLRLKGEWFEPAAGLESLRVNASFADYQHVEFEGEEEGTRFDVEGASVRLEALHLPIGFAKGVAGIHLRQRDFSAVGDEAFVPDSETQSVALYVVEGLEFSDALTMEFGVRLEQEDTKAVGQRDRDFELFSASLGVRYQLSDALAMTANLSHGERAATAEELYAFGVHVASNSFERGDADLAKERSQNLDLGLQWQGERFSGQLNAYYNQFDNFIYQATQDCNGDGEADRVEEDYSGSACVLAADDEEPLLLQHRQDAAELVGVEAKLVWNLLDRDQYGLELTLFGDSVRGELDRGANLPRLPADRVGLSLDYRQSGIRAGISWLEVLKQNEVAELETETDAYSKVDAYVSWRPLGENSGWRLMLRGENLLNETIRNHASLVKDEVPGIGRHFIIATEYQY